MAILTELQEQEASSFEYDVFLSFRGKDTRLSFTDHLYRALITDNISTFLDEQEVETGEELKPELTRAIQASRASIIVLSKDYASSTWCLDELVMILEQQQRTSNYVVVPIFYHVEPTHVRKQESSFGESMASHRKKFDEETDPTKKSQRARKLELWTRALSQVADLKGKDAHGRQETVLIEEIVKDINTRLGLHLRSKLPLLIGMERYIDYIGHWLKDKSPSKVVDILTIWGMGGIGKTTLAEYVYKLHNHEFAASSFVEGIARRCQQQSSALLDCQKQLLGDVLKKSTIEARDVNVCTAKTENALLNKQTLVVLDDIDKFEQLDSLIGTKGFHPGTKIIITTKDGSVTEKCALLFRKTFATRHRKYNMSGLSDNESIKLLLWHAFESKAPKKGYEEVAITVARYCGGHPLALKTLGGSLRNEDVATWGHILKMLEKRDFHTEIQNVLQISFNLLPSEDCKEVFKHIACFFVGKDRQVTETILNECGIHSSYGIAKLIDRCLLTVGMDNELKMHQLVQDMGRDLIRQESPKKPWKRSRLWNNEDSLNLLMKDQGTSKVLGLAFTMNTSSPVKYLRTDALAKMDKLILLQLNHVKLKGSYKNFPKELRWLCMHGFRLKSIPLDLPMANLVALDMSYSDLEKLWKKPVVLKSLKILNLSYCIKLVTVGGFSGLPSLERLILVGCVSLNRVCESIGYECAQLEVLDMSYCNKLIKLPDSIGKLKKIQIISVTCCNGVDDEFPIEMKDMESLKVLTVKRIPNLVLRSLPASLVTLSLTNSNLCNESFPIDFSTSMPMLTELRLDYNPINSLPTFVRSLSKLRELSLNGCSMLKSVLFPPSTIQYMDTWDCSSLVEIRYHQDVSRLPRTLYGYSESLNDISGIFKIQDLAQVDQKVLNGIGWTNLKSVKDQELEIGLPNMRTSKTKPVQMIYEFGIFSTCYHGKELPDWLGGHRISNGSSIISFTMPSTPVNKRFQGINIASLHASTVKKRISNINTEIVNKTKNLTWNYEGLLYVRGDEGGSEMLVWLSHWMFGENEFEDGDEVTLQILEPQPDGGEMVKECAIFVMYAEISELDKDEEEEEEENPLGYYKSWKYGIGRDLSPFIIEPGYYLINYVNLFSFNWKLK